MATEVRSSERLGAEQQQGWMDVWQANERRWNRAMNRFWTLTQNLREYSYQGIRLFTIPGEELLSNNKSETAVSARGIALELTPEELDSAPPAIKRIMQDIGVQSTDKVFLELANLPRRSEFTITIRPDEITDDRVGIILSTIKNRGAVIAPAYDKIEGDKPSTIESFPFASTSFYIDQKKVQGDKAKNIRFAYAGIAGGHSNDWRFFNFHPDMIEIMTSTANWLPSLIAARRKPASQ